MKVSVKLFARAKELAGSATLAVELREGATVADLRAALTGVNPALAAFLPRCTVAVNDEVADDDATLSEGAELAVLPPVSGGSG